MKEYIAALETLSNKQLILLLARQRARQTEGIAVVGMACRFPGGLHTPDRYWRSLRDGRVVLAEHRGVPADSTGPPSRPIAERDPAPLAGVLGQGSYLEEADHFDAGRFGIPDEEAAHLDPQQRLLLTCAQEALEDAGAGRRERTRTGVFAGLGAVEFPFAALRGHSEAEELSPYLATGAAPSAGAARIATGLRLNGPVMTVDTACASALTALHLAVGALRREECDLAVVGACQLMLSPFTTAILAKAGMLSRSGRSRPFDRAADGHVRGEGCGVLVLKRFRDAEDAGDRPYALIRGSAVHQHGDRPSMAAVSAAGQRETMEQALRSADVHPHAVQYVEAQANGSRLGGIVEVEAIAAAYRRERAEEPGAPSLYLGSAKANLGYLEAASGVAGLIKAVLALHHRTIPPQPGFDDPDPAVPWERMALEVPRSPISWPDVPRRIAGVSAFGFTGTNAHVLLEGPDHVRP